MGKHRFIGDGDPRRDFTGALPAGTKIVVPKHRFNEAQVEEMEAARAQAHQAAGGDRDPNLRLDPNDPNPNRRDTTRRDRRGPNVAGEPGLSDPNLTDTTRTGGPR
jgi:hypothetical protein